MMNQPLSLLIQEQIRKEIKKLVKTGELPIVETGTTGFKVESENVLSNLPNSKMLYPALESILRYRLVSGAEPIKISQNTLYIHPAMAYFEDLNEPVIADGTMIEIPSYAEDRWVWVYLQEDGTYTANKYPPNIGDNQQRIAICKVWKEAGSDDFDEKTLRDIRKVGFASANLNHLLRQVFLNFFLSMPKVQVSEFTIQGKDLGDGNLYVEIDGTLSSVLYARLTPVPKTTVQIPKPDDSSTKHYFVLVAGQVDNNDPDDLKFMFKVKEITEPIEQQEYPICIVKNITNSTTEILPENIVYLGVKRNYKENYIYTRKIKDSFTDTQQISNKYLLVPYTATITSIIVKTTGNFDSVSLVIEGLNNSETTLNDGINYIENRVYPNDQIKIRGVLAGGETSGEIELEIFFTSQL